MSCVTCDGHSIQKQYVCHDKKFGMEMCFLIKYINEVSFYIKIAGNTTDLHTCSVECKAIS